VPSHAFQSFPAWLAPSPLSGAETVPRRPDEKNSNRKKDLGGKLVTEKKVINPKKNRSNSYKKNRMTIVQKCCELEKKRIGFLGQQALPQDNPLFIGMNIGCPIW